MRKYTEMHRMCCTWQGCILCHEATVRKGFASGSRARSGWGRLTCPPSANFVVGIEG